MQNFYILAIFIVLFLINSVSSAETDIKETHYIVHVNDPSIPNKNKKRQELSGNVLNAIYQIHDLIINNIDSYKNTTALEEMESEGNELRKRNLEDEYEDIDSYPRESDYVVQIGEAFEYGFLYTYLSPVIFKAVEQLPNINFIEENLTYEPEGYNLKDIKKNTGWSKVEVKNNVPLYLSLISQGKYSSSLIGQYDNNYYYPSTSGKGVDVYVIDGGFNFKHENFDNTKERKVECIAHGKKSVVKSYKSNTKVCKGSDDHGTTVATIIGGKNDGVAHKANIYGLYAEKFDDVTIIKLLNYIQKEKVKNSKNRAIINISAGAFHSLENYHKSNSNEKSMELLIRYLQQHNFVIVASGGNDNRKIVESKEVHLPSAFKEVISVGQINSSSVDQVDNGFTKHKKSNYGVDFFAPTYIEVSIRNTKNKLVKLKDSGTSYSSAIVSGVCALVMGENKNKYYDTFTMRDYLNTFALKNAVKNIYGNNYFINNGKNIVYSANNVYHNSCGVRGGNRSCGSNKCCAKNFKCYKTSNKNKCSINNGCKKKFGVCLK